jgi:hypothetical protein
VAARIARLTPDGHLYFTRITRGTDLELQQAVRGRGWL